MRKKVAFTECKWAVPATPYPEVKNSGGGMNRDSSRRALAGLAAVAAGLLLSACGGGQVDKSTSSEALQASVGDSRTRAMAVAEAASQPIIADGFVALRNVGDPTVLIGRSNTGSYFGSSPVAVSSAPALPVPPEATLFYQALTPQQASDMNSPESLGCGYLGLRGFSLETFVALEMLQISVPDGKLTWQGNVQTRAATSAATNVVCPEQAPGGRGVYLRWRSFPGQVLTLTKGQLALAPEATTPAFIASATFDANPVPAFLNNRPPTVGSDAFSCERFCGDPRVTKIPERAAGSTVLIDTVTSDPEGQIDRVELLDDQKVVATSTVAPYTVTWVPIAVGRKALRLRAWDKQGAWTDSLWDSPVDVVVAGSSSVLSATIVSPAPGATVEAGYHFIDFRVNDTRGPNFGAHGWLYDGAQLIVDHAYYPDFPTNSTNRVWLEPGLHVLTPVVTDKFQFRLTGTSQTLKVVVPPDAPAIKFLSPTAGTVLKLGEKFQVRLDVAGAKGPFQVSYVALPVKPASSITPLTSLELPLTFQVFNAPPYALDSAFLPAGEWNVLAYVTDATGKVFRSAPVKMSVVASLPKLVAPATASINVPVTLTTFAEGSIDVGKVTFYDPAGGWSSFDTNAPAGQPYAVSWTPKTTGVHSLYVAVENVAGTTRVISAIVNVVVKGPDNLPPTVSIAPTFNSQGGLAGQPIVVKATPGDFDGYIRRVEFYDGATLFGTATASPWSATWTGAAGVHVLTAKAFDNSGNSTTSKPVTVTLKSSNVAPTVSIRFPVAGSTIQADTPTTVLTSPGDADGYIRRVEFFDGSTLIGTATTKPWAVTWTPTAGSHSLTAKAIDNSDVATTSKPVVVTAAP